MLKIATKIGFYLFLRNNCLQLDVFYGCWEYIKQLTVNFGYMGPL